MIARNCPLYDNWRRRIDAGKTQQNQFKSLATVRLLVILWTVLGSDSAAPAAQMQQWDCGRWRRAGIAVGRVWEPSGAASAWNSRTQGGCEATERLTDIGRMK
jgi:hypothetical protein